jgi:hypothetical protein
MKCVDCPYFEIKYEPLGRGKDLWDFGQAACSKYDLVVDFADHKKINRLVCINEMAEGKQIS